MAIELTVVVPTFNERENVRPLINSVDDALPDVSWEIVFVDDDSNDGTADEIRSCASNDDRIRCLQRIKRRGLSSACIEGMMSSSAPFLAVIDADMQHDERKLPTMLEILKSTENDLVVASRYMQGGSTGDFVGFRLLVSRTATLLSQFLLGTQLSDPMSGFFMVKRAFLDRVVRKVYGKGFKILLDLFASSERPVKYEEVPYTMRTRQLGESKLGIMVTFEFFMMLLFKLSGRLIPGHFIKFSSVGLVGVGVHLFTLFILNRVFDIEYVSASSVSTLIAMTNNYVLNNQFTYRDQKLHGLDFIIGLLKFYIACSLGAVISVALASYLFDQGFSWWLAGFTGAVAAAIWNFTTTSAFTWGSSSSKLKKVS